MFVDKLYFALFLILLKTSSAKREPNRNGNMNRDFEPLVKRPVLENKINVYVSSAAGAKFAFHQIDFNQALFRNVEASLVIDLDKTIQKIDGFGGSFTDAACQNLMNLPENVRQEIVDDYFDPEYGLEYVLGRTTIGCSDFSSRIYTLDDIEDDYELNNFSLAIEDFEYKIPIIKMAMKYVPDIKIIASLWSPPVWLKTNKRINHIGSIVGPVTGKSYQTFANYLVKYLDAYKRGGIQIYGISPANEPTNGRYVPFFPFNCVGFSSTQMRDFIVETLGPTLKRAGYDKEHLKLMIVDDQRFYLKYWVDTIMAHPDASDYVTHIGYHWYFNQFAPAKILDTIKQKYPTLYIWSTEACTGSYTLFRKHVELGSWLRAEKYAKDITIDLNHNTNAWIDWNLALNTEGGPNWSGNYADAPIIIDLNTKKYTRQPMFYALAHFSKFIKPNSRNLQQNLNIQSKWTWFGSLYTTSFKSPDNQIVVVVTNTFNSDMRLNITVVQQKNRVIFHIVPKKSITTFVWKI